MANKLERYCLLEGELYKGGGLLAHSSLRKVAELSGVSVSTASRALNGHPDVSKKTRARVLKAAEELAYTPNSLARGLWSGQTMTIGVVVTTILNPFYANLVAGVEKALSDQGYTILLNSSYGEPEKEWNALKLLIQQRVDGMILGAVQTHPEAVELLVRNSIPFVLLGSDLPDATTDFVASDDMLVGKLAVNHLVEKGYDKILFLNARQSYSAKLRAAGFSAAIEANHPKVKKHWIKVIRSKEDVQRTLHEASEEGIDPNAILCFNDDVAIEVIRYLKDRKLRIPADVGVMGVDNLDVGSILNPRLTTIDINKNEIGITAAQVLLRRMENKDRAVQRVVLRPSLVERDST